MKETLLINLDAAPLQEQIEDGHQKSESHLEVLPDAMQHVFAVSDSGQQREDAFDQHADIPGAALANLEILRITFFAMKARIGADDHASGKLLKQRVKLGVRDIGGGRLPSHDQAPLIQDHAKFATHNPARVRLTFLSKTLTFGEAQCSDRMTQLNPKRVRHAQHGRFGKEARRAGPGAS